MSEHTPGKLYARELDLAGWVDIVTTDPDGTMSLPFIACKHHDPEANARRLVACWNALADLPQDALDGGWTRAGLEAYGLQMKAEADTLCAVNAELLEALERFELWADSQADAQSKGGHATFDIMALREERDAARAAIASARKQGEQG